VKVGNLEYDLGLLKYISVISKHESGWWPIGVGVAGGVLIVAIVVLIVVFMRKNWYNERQYRRLQSQLDALESSVRNECKRGIGFNNVFGNGEFSS
jgi:plexin A